MLARRLFPLLFVAAWGCGPAAATPPDANDGGAQSVTPSIVHMPAMRGDCTKYFDLSMTQVPLDWSSLTFEAGNCGGDGSGCLLVQDTGADVPSVMWTISVPLAQLGQPIDLSKPPAGFSFTLNITTSTYGLLATGPGIVGGTLTVATLDPVAGNATIHFEGVTLSGSDDADANERCGIDGDLIAAGFASTPLGSPCTTDQECGGPGSGRVCGESSFACVAGSHTDDDCPGGSLCDTGTSSCTQTSSASADEIAICQKACHGLFFFQCIADEGSCDARCSSDVRSKVQAFDDCTDGTTLECEAGHACVAGL